MTFEPYPPASAIGGDHAFFDTVAQMQSGVLANGDQCHTAGYSAVGDGGGSADGYTYHSTGQSGETEDGGFVIFGTVGDDYFTANKSVVNVLQFGVAPSVASTAAIRLAMNAAITAGVPLYFPPGNTYVLDDILVPTGDLTVHAEDAVIQSTAGSLVFRLEDGSGAPDLTLLGGRYEMSGGAGGACVYKTETGATGALTIRNCEFDGAGVALFGVWASTSVTSSGSVSIRDSVFTNFVQGGIQYNAGGIASCLIEGVTVDTVTALSALAVTGITVGQNDDAVITEGFVQVSNCYVKNVTTAFTPSPLHGILVLSYRCSISDCHVENCRTSLGNFDDSGIYTKSNHSIKQNNRVLNSGGGQGAIASKGRPREDPHTVGTAYGYSSIIANNTVVFDANDIGTGLRTGILLGSEETVTGNRLEGCILGMNANGVDNAIIANNYFFKPQDHSVTFSDAQHVLIIDNQTDGWLAATGGFPRVALYGGQISTRDMVDIEIRGNKTFNTDAAGAAAGHIIYLNPGVTFAIRNTRLIDNPADDPNVLRVYDTGGAIANFVDVYVEGTTDATLDFNGLKNLGKIYKKTHTLGGKVGWVLTTEGRPGTWTEFGAIDP